MNSGKKTGLFLTCFLWVLLFVAGTMFLTGCAAGGGPVTKAKDGVAATGLTTDTVPENYAESIGFLAQRVDTLREKFMMMPGSRLVPAGFKEKWSLLTAEAERLKGAVNANGKLEYVLGELSRIGIFFDIPDAAQTAEYYLTECVGLGGSLEDRDYRPYFSLAWLNLHQGCQLSGKTRDLLLESEKRIPDWESPYCAMLWGYYYYSCKDDPEKAKAYFETYLAFDPADKLVVKIYQSIKKEAAKK